MKTRILTAALSFLALTAVAQKSEIRSAGNAVDDENYAEAKAELQKAETQLADANDRWTERFYLYKGQAYLGDGENTNLEDLKTAAEAFKQAIEMGSDEAQQGLVSVRSSLVQSAIADQNSENFESASDKLYTSYELNKQDTVYLYYAAANSLNAKDYDTALEYYQELRDLGFDGADVEYLATNVETGEQESMSEKQRDLMVKTGEYENPQERQIPSKKGEIAKNIALIYIAQEKEDEAIAAMEEAKKENPDDVRLMQAEADMYYRMGNKEKYNEVMQEVMEMDPDNPSVYYNLGISSAELGENDKAIEFYKKALELDPDLNDARMNIAVAILAKEREIIAEMNELGMSKEDSERYDELSAERQEIYREAMPYLEDVIEYDPQNVNAIRTAKNIYSQLGEEEKAAEMEELLNQ